MGNPQHHEDRSCTCHRLPCCVQCPISEELWESGRHPCKCHLHRLARPHRQGQPLTINMAGDLSAAITAGKLAVDLNIKALGIINEPLKLTVPFTLAPGIPGPGPVTAKIGPFNLPSVPGSVDISGTVTGTDASGAEIFCASLNIALGSVAENPMSEVITVGAAPVVSNCGAATDHFKNITTSATGGVKTLTGTLDEAVSSGEADVDLTVKVLFITVPIKTTVPFAISPGVPAGPIKVSFGPVQKAAETNSGISIKIDGTVKVSDGKASEIACLKLTTP